jgi:hypothetical protein
MGYKNEMPMNHQSTRFSCGISSGDSFLKIKLMESKIYIKRSKVTRRGMVVSGWFIPKDGRIVLTPSPTTMSINMLRVMLNVMPSIHGMCFFMRNGRRSNPGTMMI